MSGKKIILIGEAGSGKSVWIKKCITGDFEKKYIPTLGCEIYPLSNNKYSLWDTAGQEKYGGLRDGYYLNSDGAIIFMDSSFKTSYKNILKKIDSFRAISPNAKVVFFISKMDISKKEYVDSIISIASELKVEYYLISTKTNTLPNIEEIF